MSAIRAWWHQVGKGLLRLHNDGERRSDQHHRVEDPQAPSVRPTITHKLSAADRDGAMVARSQIQVSGSTATLLGTLTNETGFDVHFSGMPPYASTFDTDGSAPILLGDFNTPPRDQPSSGDWVIHPGASVPYRSLPVTLQNPDPRWDGTDWSTSSQSTTLDIKTFSNQRDLRTVHIFN